MTSEETRDQSWNPDLYEDRHSFVWKLGSSLVELLAPEPQERILDLGCGTGQLTFQIAQTGAAVVGVDSSPAMVDESRRNYPHLRFELADAHELGPWEPFDAVFSNAVLHWIHDPDKVASSIAQALKPNGRLVAEFGGKGNVEKLTESIVNAARAVLGRNIPHPWYFPSIGQFAEVLESHGLEVVQAALIDRPTPLEGEDGLRNWVRMFGSHWLDPIPEERREEFFRRVEDESRPLLYRDGGWIADYRRLRVVARRVA